MIKIESIKDYKGLQFLKIALKVYKLTEFAKKDYPNYSEWFFTKQLPESITNKRNILFVRNPDNKENIIAICNLKKTNEEKKLCTIYVKEEYRHQGIGSIILSESMKWLETFKPFFTIADYKSQMMLPFINKYNWQLTETINNNNKKELYFNGYNRTKERKRNR